MSAILPNIHIDDLPLQKFIAAEKMKKVLSFIKQKESEGLIKTASNEDLMLSLFAKMITYLSMKLAANNTKEVYNNLSKDAQESTEPELNKTSSVKKTGAEKKDEIKIVSKHIKDSHYQVDVSKDIITQDDKKVYMVSCYARDAYLGRYLIKRNYFFSDEREKFADNAYDEIMLKFGALKDRYYNEIIDVSAITTQMKKILDGVISEIQSEEDTIATNINRINRY